MGVSPEHEQYLPVLSSLSSGETGAAVAGSCVSTRGLGQGSAETLAAFSVGGWRFAARAFSNPESPLFSSRNLCCSHNTEIAERGQVRGG
jgi:hypothetical protein